MTTLLQTGTAFVPTVQRVGRFFGELIFIDSPWARQVYIANNVAAMAHYPV